MEHRIGECSSCGAAYKLPASFAHDQARCKNCGGVVEIGPVQQVDGPKAPAPAPRGAPPVPARKVAPAPRPAAAPAPAKPASPAPLARADQAPQKRPGPSMKEQILARQHGSQAKPTAPAPAPARPKASAPAPKAAPARPAAAQAPAKAGAKVAAAAPARGGAARRGSARAEGEEHHDRGSGRGRAKKQNASLLPGLVAIVLLLAMGGAAAYFITSSGKPAADGVAAAQPDSGAPAAPSADATQLPAAKEAAPAKEVEAPKAPAAEAEAKPAKKEAEPKRGDPDSVDLSAIPDYDPIPGTSPERWDELRQLVADMIDPQAGAAGNRAKLKLEQAGKEAFPALLNSFKRIDLSTEDGFRAADVIQTTLRQICNGINFGWLYQHQDNWLYYDKKAIQSWAKTWDKAKDDEKAWLKLIKADKQAADAEAKPDEPKKGGELSGEDFDFDFDDG